MRGWLALLAFFQITAAAAQPSDCQLDSFRARIDRTVQSIQVDTRKEAEIVDAKGTRFRHIDYGFSGEIEGCVVLSGPIPALKPNYSYLYDSPEIALPQEHLLAASASHPYRLPLQAGDGNQAAPLFATGRFEAKDGAGFDLFLPKDLQKWNGKLFISQRGSGSYNPLEKFPTRSASDSLLSGSGAGIYVENMLARGYAVAYLRKDAIRPPLGISKARLKDGRELTTTFVSHAGLALAMIEFAQKEVATLTGRRPAKTLYYGHSGGAMTGRLINYSGGNVNHEGKPIVDALIVDDVGNGVYSPVAFKDGRDVLFATDEQRRRFVPQIDIARELYFPTTFLEAKRYNRELLVAKGLGSLHRYYQISGASHFDHGMAIAESKTAKPVDDLDLTGFMSAMIDALDLWATSGTAPPPQLQGSVVLPEVACPLGVYYVPPGRGVGTMMTRLLAYDATSVEPKKNEAWPGEFVDANQNGRQDTAENVTSAWRRLHLISATETVDKEKYLACVEKSANDLIAAKLLPAEASAWYKSRAALLLENAGARFQ